MSFDVVKFYDEKMQDLLKEKIGFPRLYFELSYDQRVFLDDFCQGILEQKQKTEDLNDALARLKDHHTDLTGLVKEFDDVIDSVRMSLDQIKK